MRITYFKEHSKILGLDMEYNVYGHAGKLCLVFPCQDGRFYEWEDRGMFSLVQNEIEAGQSQFVCVDSIDPLSWSNAGDVSSRMYMHEKYVQYIMQELLPKFGNQTWMCTGCSMGGYHAFNMYLRFPDTFTQVLSMSGVYDMEPFFLGQGNDLNAYQNDPYRSIANMDVNHAYIAKYNQNQAILVVGKGAWEEHCISDLKKMMHILIDKGIQAEYYIYPYDYVHDWSSWQVYFPKYIKKMIQKK